MKCAVMVLLSTNMSTSEIWSFLSLVFIWFCKFSIRAKSWPLHHLNTVLRQSFFHISCSMAWSSILQETNILLFLIKWMHTFTYKAALMFTFLSKKFKPPVPFSPLKQPHVITPAGNLSFYCVLFTILIVTHRTLHLALSIRNSFEGTFITKHHSASIFWCPGFVLLAQIDVLLSHFFCRKSDIVSVLMVSFFSSLILSLSSRAKQLSLIFLFFFLFHCW